MIVNVHLEKDEILEKKKKTEPKPAYQKIGNGIMNHKIKHRSIDLLKEIAQMNADEKFCFFAIKDKIHFDPHKNDFIYQVNISPTRIFSSSDAVKFRRGFKLLESKDIVRRVKRGVYMITPLGLIPNNFAEELKVWEDAEPAKQ